MRSESDLIIRVIDACLLKMDVEESLDIVTEVHGWIGDLRSSLEEQVTLLEMVDAEGRPQQDGQVTAGRKLRWVETSAVSWCGRLDCDGVDGKDLYLLSPVLWSPLEGTKSSRWWEVWSLKPNQRLARRLSMSTAQQVAEAHLAGQRPEQWPCSGHSHDSRQKHFLSRDGLVVYTQTSSGPQRTIVHLHGCATGRGSCGGAGSGLRTVDWRELRSVLYACSPGGEPLTRAKAEE